MAKTMITFYPQKQGVALLRAPKPTKMTKMAGAPQTKPPFAKNTVFATLIQEVSTKGARLKALGDSGKTSGESKVLVFFWV